MQFRISLLLWVTALFWVACQNSAEQAQENTTTTTTSTSAEEPSTEKTNEKIILFFGNSLTAGYGLDQSEAFPDLIQNRMDSLGLSYRVVNAGLSGETTASGNTRLDWVLERQPVDVFVLELGANDGLRGISPKETYRNLNLIVDKVQETYPDAQIILAGMMVPPSMGPDYSSEFQKIFPAVAEEQDIALIPFLLQDVAGEPELKQADGVHPTTEGQKIVADNVWGILQPLLESAS